ncbi:hypothetical protein AAFF_G00398130 [Aldrovandia affinis]|uniref:Uncharacterized protein n=1 Tax=Aldrovandia affinis TaxID=143900 RepID=A0AAD7R4C1_9TELE|nr:hypothetical protein AAFF_G00398130 [Aldrovandia affinis]
MMSSDHRILHALTCSFTDRHDNDDPLEGAMRLVNSGPEGTVSVIQASVRSGSQFHKTTGLMSCVVSPPPPAKRNDVSTTTVIPPDSSLSGGAVAGIVVDGAISSTACLKEVFELYDPMTEVTEMMSSDHRILHALTCSFTDRRDNDDPLEGAMRLDNSGPEGTVSVIQASVRSGSQFHKTTGLMSCVVSPPPPPKRNDVSTTTGLGVSSAQNVVLNGVVGQSVAFPDAVKKSGSLTHNGDEQLTIGDVTDAKFMDFREGRVQWNNATGLFSISGLKMEDSGVYTLLNNDAKPSKDYHYQLNVDDSSLSGGAVAGIVVGLLLFVAVIIILIIAMRKNQRMPGWSAIFSRDAQAN